MIIKCTHNVKCLYLLKGTWYC